MTWDPTWIDITDLDGLKRSRIIKEHYNDLIAALNERYNVTESVNAQSHDKIFLPPHSLPQYDSFSPWSSSSYQDYYDPSMWDEDNELVEQYDPTGKTEAEWTGFKNLDGSSSSPPAKRSICKSSDMVFFKEVLKLCKNPNTSLAIQNVFHDSVQTMFVKFVKLEATYYKNWYSPNGIGWIRVTTNNVPEFEATGTTNYVEIAESLFAQYMAGAPWVDPANVLYPPIAEPGDFSQYLKTTGSTRDGTYWVTHDLSIEIYGGIGCKETNYQKDDFLLNGKVSELDHRLRFYKLFYCLQGDDIQGNINPPTCPACIYTFASNDGYWYPQPLGTETPIYWTRSTAPSSVGKPPTEEETTEWGKTERGASFSAVYEGGTISLIDQIGFEYV